MPLNVAPTQPHLFAAFKECSSKELNRLSSQSWSLHDKSAIKLFPKSRAFAVLGSYSYWMYMFWMGLACPNHMSGTAKCPPLQWLPDWATLRVASDSILQLARIFSRNICRKNTCYKLYGHDCHYTAWVRKNISSIICIVIDRCTFSWIKKRLEPKSLKTFFPKLLK